MSGARLGFLLAATTALLWGVLPFALNALLQQLTPLTINWYRFSSAAVVLLLWLASRSGLGQLRQLRRTHLLLLAVAIIGLLGNYLFFLAGLARASAVTTQVVIQLGPAFLLLGSLLFLGERFDRWQWGGFVLLLCGQLLFFHARLEALLRGLDHESAGVLLIILAALLWAGYALAQKELLRRLSSAAIMMLIYFAGGVLFWPFAEPAQVVLLDATGWGLLIFCCLNTLIAYGCFAESLNHWQASRVSAVIAITPLITLVTAKLAAPWLDAHSRVGPLDFLTLLGAALVVGGAMVSALSGERMADSKKASGLL